MCASKALISIRAKRSPMRRLGPATKQTRGEGMQKRDIIKNERLTCFREFNKATIQPLVEHWARESDIYMFQNTLCDFEQTIVSITRHTFITLSTDPAVFAAFVRGILSLHWKGDAWWFINFEKQHATKVLSSEFCAHPRRSVAPTKVTSFKRNFLTNQTLRNNHFHKIFEIFTSKQCSFHKDTVAERYNVSEIRSCWT